MRAEPGDPLLGAEADGGRLEMLQARPRPCWTTTSRRCGELRGLSRGWWVRGLCQSTRCLGRGGFLTAACSASSRKDSALATASRAGRVLKTQLR